MRAQMKRLDRISPRILALPIAPAIAREALDKFRETGELPDDDRLAHLVLERARQGPKLAHAYESGADFGALIRASMETPPRPEDPIMDALYEEAIWAPAPARWAARYALQGLARAGIDVTTAAFAGRFAPDELAAYGFIGVRLIGFPSRLARKPYVAQAKRLFRRCEKMCELIPQDDPTWRDRLDHATERFQLHGEAPDDPIVLDMVLILGEMHGLMEHAAGEGDPEFLAACDRAARGKQAERAAAIEALLQMAQDGRFAADGEDVAR